MSVTEESKTPVFTGMHNIENKMIDTDSLAYMLTNDIGNNDKKYVVEAKTFNNEYVERWKNDFLKPRAVENKVTVAMGMDLWEIWNQANEIKGLMSLEKELCVPNKETVDYWLKVFEKPCEELAEMGKLSIAIGFHILKTAYGMWFIREKYEKAFKSDTHEDWISGYRKHNMIFTRKVEPFSLKEIVEKFKIVSLNTYDTTIRTNEFIMVENVKLFNKRYIEQFTAQLKSEDLIKENLEELSESERKDMWMLWTAYNDTKNLLKHPREHLSLPSKEQVDWWLNFFTKSIEELLKYGQPCVSMGHHLIGTDYNTWYIDQKSDKVFLFSEPLSIKELYSRYKTHIDLFKRKIFPYSIEEVVEKATTITMCGIRPRK